MNYQIGMNKKLINRIFQMINDYIVSTYILTSNNVNI